ncbi:tripartite tricarboxylate transporter TctB family protein [Falsirhodobacter sp. 1013]|uniref:tripartite tricarboxylate transporter TctB family protein n=1 Tax=Falsirhodobacter sp. 1013 TaxID=3417566 RepID=UPI003EBC3E9F
MTLAHGTQHDGAPASPLPGNAAPAPAHLRQNAVTAVLCTAASAGFLLAALRLPAGHSRGDVGPGALPVQIAVGALVLSLVYLLLVWRRASLGGSDDGFLHARALALLGLTLMTVAGAKVVGLALSLAVAMGVGTLLFAGSHALVRAGATAVGLWLIAHFLFAVFLGLPLP